MPSQTKFRIISKGGVEEGTGTRMEVDSIVVEMATRNTQVYTK
jgi:hypothetical protein